MNTNASHIESLIKKINKTSCNITVTGDKIRVQANKRPKTFQSLETLPYPDFPTDLQPQMVSLASISNGKTKIVENLFETRFKHISELVKMGADIKVKGNTAFVTGKEKLQANEVTATDLRGGACLVMAGLVAEGKTVVNDVYHIDRGYQKIEKMFEGLGANIVRVEG